MHFLMPGLFRNRQLKSHTAAVLSPFLVAAHTHTDAVCCSHKVMAFATDMACQHKYCHVSSRIPDHIDRDPTGNILLRCAWPSPFRTRLTCAAIISISHNVYHAGREAIARHINSRPQLQKRMTSMYGSETVTGKKEENYKNNQ